MYAFLSPVLMFSIVMLERFFYSNVEGSLGLIKLLETAAMSVSFLLEVLFMNKFIAQLGAANYKPEKIMSLLKSQFLKAAFLGIILMSIITLSIIGLFEYGAFPFKISAELNEYFLALSFLYLVYFLVVICRDYIERFYFSINKPKPVVSANFVLLMLTLLFNWLFLAYAPISIAVISILLMGFKVAYLVLGAKTYVNNSEVRGDYV
ncbi:MAG: hypothetical protein AXW17_13155 [Colwellia sp. Phe_37]|nr:MAG: hypothetical protein AXW17_13155 [Colwellia sp. Phe_37]